MYNKEYYKIYSKKYLGNIYKDSYATFLNLPIEDLKDLATKQLKDGIPVWMGAHIMKFRDKKSGILDIRLYDYRDTLDFNPLSKKEALDLHDIEMHHAMTFCGVHLLEDKPVRWKIEDSYGDKEKVNGYYIMNDNFFNEFVLSVVIDKKYLTEEQLKLLEQEPIEFDDLCETKEVSSGGAIYLDMNENLPDATAAEAELEKLLKKDPENPRVEELRKQIEDGHCYIFVGRVGRFTPVKTGAGGGLLMCLRRGKYSAVTGSSGYRWMESEMVRINQKEEFIDRDYYRGLVDDAREEIGKYGDFDTFVSEEAPIHPWFSAIDEDALPFNVNEDNDELPWYTDVESA